MTDRDIKIKLDTWEGVIRESLKIVIPTEGDARSFGDLLKKFDR